MKDLRPTRKILGMQIKINRIDGSLFLTQESYIEKVVKMFSLHESKPVSLLLSTCVKLSTNHSPKIEDKFDRMVNVPYSNAVYCVMVCSRPDISLL